MTKRIKQDTTSADISPTLVHIGKVSRAVPKDPSSPEEMANVSEYTLEHLKDVLKELGRGEVTPELAQALVERASVVGCPLPDWVMEIYRVNAEHGKYGLEVFQPILILEKGDVPGITVVQEGSPANNGVMTIRLPFFVGESISHTPGIDSKLYFPTKLLPAIVQAGNAQITEGRQPLTVYARHAHALSASHLPVGRVARLEQEGRIGYATLEIAPTGDGKDVQTLIKNGMLNADSLRSGPGRFALENRHVNEEEMLEVTKLELDGIDFAPDGPAMATYGVEVLAAEARVEEIPNPKGGKPVEELSLEMVRGKSEIVSAIEAPLRKELEEVKATIAKLTQEREEAMSKLAEVEKEKALREIASKLPKPEEAYAALQEYCKDAKTAEEIAVRALPVILMGMDKARELAEKTSKPREQSLLEKLFPGTGSGQIIQEEAKPKVGVETVNGLALPD